MRFTLLHFSSLLVFFLGLCLSPRAGAYSVLSHEEVVELRHTAHVYQDTKVEPDFQCVIRLRATSAVCDAAALGAQTDVQF